VLKTIFFTAIFRRPIFLKIFKRLFSKKKHERKSPQGWGVAKCRDTERSHPLKWVVSISRDYWIHFDRDIIWKGSENSEFWEKVPRIETFFSEKIWFCDRREGEKTKFLDEGLQKLSDLDWTLVYFISSILSHLLSRFTGYRQPRKGFISQRLFSQSYMWSIWCWPTCKEFFLQAFTIWPSQIGSNIENEKSQLQQVLGFRGINIHVYIYTYMYLHIYIYVQLYWYTNKYINFVCIHV